MAVSAAQITTDAKRYVGRGYVYGGDASAPGLWDCSSFISYVLGHDLGLALPGGKWGDPGFPPHDHGPVVTSYADWSGAHPVASPQPGDLVCFVGEGASGHIGIVLGPDLMISALDPADGTKITPIEGYGPAGAPIVYRRILGVPAGPPQPGTPHPGGGTSTGATALVAVLVLAGALAAVIVTASLIGGAVAAATGAITSAGRPQPV